MSARLNLSSPLCLYSKSLPQWELPYWFGTNAHYPTNTPISMLFFPIAFLSHLAYIFYRLLITTKRMLISTKAWVLFVLSDSVPSTPRVLETDVAPNNPLLNKWTLWGVNGIMYNIYCSWQVVGVQEILISILISAHIDYNICHSINNCIKWHITMETNSQRNLS